MRIAEPTPQPLYIEVTPNGALLREALGVLLNAMFG